MIFFISLIFRISLYNESKTNLRKIQNSESLRIKKSEKSISSANLISNNSQSQINNFSFINKKEFEDFQNKNQEEENIQRKNEEKEREIYIEKFNENVEIEMNENIKGK